LASQVVIKKTQLIRDGPWPNPARAYFWPTINRRWTHLYDQGIFWPDENFFVPKVKNWKTLWQLNPCMHRDPEFYLAISVCWSLSFRCEFKTHWETDYGNKFQYSIRFSSIIYDDLNVELNTWTQIMNYWVLSTGCW